MTNQTAHASIQRVAWLALRAQRGESVTYSTGSYSKTITAVKTRPISSQVDAGENVIISSRSWDWLIDPAELTSSAGEQLEPGRGHKITDAAGNVYRLAPGNSGDGVVWRWSDSLKTWRRAHTEEE